MSHKKALITGASRGIGRAIANQLAREGYDLYLTCLRSIDSLQEFSSRLEADCGISCIPFQGDMGDWESVSRLFSRIDRLDVLVNNAGISHIGLLQDMHPDEWRRIMATNLDSCF